MASFWLNNMTSIMETTIVPPSATTDLAAANANASNATDAVCYPLEHYPESTASFSFHVFVTIGCVVIGLIGNTLSMLVFSSKEMRPVSSNFYLLILALSDSAYLLTVFMTKVLPILRCMYFFWKPEVDIYNNTDFNCKMLQYMIDLFSNFSTCLILAFTIERSIAVYMPLRFKELCTSKRARIACFVTFLIISVAIAPYHFIMMGRYENYNVCSILQEYEDWFFPIYIAEMLLFRVLPVFVIAVLNVFIIVKVTKMSNLKKQMKATTSTNPLKKRVKKDDRSSQLTLILILVSTTYILTYLPVLVHYTLWKLKRNHIIDVSEASLIITQNYVKTLYVSGYAINFFLYTVSGRVFREQLENILTPQCTPNHDYAHANGNHTEMTQLVQEK